MYWLEVAGFTLAAVALGPGAVYLLPVLVDKLTK